MLTSLNKKVLSYCEIPEDIDRGWLDECSPDSYVIFNVEENKENRDELDNWIVSNYPELENETFLIHIDY